MFLSDLLNLFLAGLIFFKIKDVNLSAAEIINVLFRIIAALAYCLLGVYVAFWLEAQLGFWFEVSINVYLGLLFLAYGFFRFWRAYLYYKELNEDEYGEYGS
jgi:hypothetical protein